MATRMLRRGLPRVAGGDPWPPASDVEVADAPAMDAVAEAVAVAPVAGSAPIAAPAPAVAAEAQVAVAEPTEVSDTSTLSHPSTGSGSDRSLRRGLPRTPGGEPWPPSDTVATPASAPVEAAAPVTAAVPAVVEASVADASTSPASAVPASAEVPDPLTGSGVGEGAAAVDGAALRRGLPRTPGGEPWPPAGATAQVVVAADAEPTVASAPATAPVSEAAVAASTAPQTALAAVDVSTPLPFQRTVFAGRNAFTRPAPTPEPERIGPFTKVQWAGTVIVAGIALLGAAAMAVLLVRWLLSFGGLQDFVQTYPGEYHLPEGAPVGFPAWLGWQHFFNVFLMVLIIRTGLSVRHDKRPTAFWTARGNDKTKISLTLWFHQALDILWLVNGIIFVVLLFATGQWMRVIPTSWDVIPNAISAALQYVSLDWPTENGWVNYNSLQQLAYGTTIFIAAPLAAITGVRMSGLWPKNAAKLSKVYPVELARALHFPVMLYFVVFIAIHVILVFATGALRNLNHMYAAQGSVDGVAYADNWTGFWMLVASLVVIAAAWVAARPLVLAPIAKLFGSVSAR